MEIKILFVIILICPQLCKQFIENIAFACTATQCISCPNDICDSCNTGYYLLNSQSLGNYCSICGQGCTACSNWHGYCQICESQYYNLNGICCPPQCATCIGPTGCQTCIGGYYYYNWQCLPCQSPCLTCITTPTNCTGCNPGKVLIGSTCTCTLPCSQCVSNPNNCTQCIDSANQLPPTCQCISAKYMNNNYCSPCVSPCFYCLSATYCLSCVSGFFLSGSTCIKCPNGTFDNGTSCSPCVLPCINCSSLTICTSCNHSPLQTIPSCNCPNAYYQDSLYKCESCQNPCNNCIISPINCTSCLATYYLYTTVTPNTCLSCDSPCLNCTSGSACTSCVSTYYLQGTSCLACQRPCANCSVSASNCLSCIDIHQTTSACNCQSGYLMDSTSKLCISCTFPCATCSITLTHCLTCASTYTYNSTTYTCACLINQFEQYGTPKTCQNCTSPCQTCSGISTRCTSCLTAHHRHLKTATNQCACDNGFYDNGSATCQSCISPCSNCISASICSCAEGEFSDVGICHPCTSPCFDCNTNDTTCISCIDKYYLNGSTCHPCTLPCQNCVDNSTKCTSCAINQIISNNTCVCPDGYYMDNTFICQLCTHPCMNCVDNPAKCLTCASTYSLSSTTPYTCYCIDGYYEELTDTPTDCRLCTSPCKTCIINTNHCVSCIDSHQIINATNQCICKDGFLTNGTKCEQCNNPCTNCLGSINYCTSCKDPHHILSGGVCSCDNGWLIDSYKDCQVCVSPCKTCITTTTNCVTCTDVNHLKNAQNQCYCKDKYFSDSISTCMACTLPCDKCNASGCLTCIDTSQTIDASLHCICPDYYYIDINSNYHCTHCQLPCVKCISQLQCLTCIDTLQTLINNQCICHDTYYILNSYCQPCQLPCINCQINANTCLTCSDPNHILINNQCICKDGYVKSDNTGIHCLPCQYPCEKCIINVSTCTQCIDKGQYRLSNNQCICQHQFYQKGLQCHQCSPQCEECIDQSDFCLKCSDLNHLFMQNDCFCQNGYYNGLQMQCIECKSPCATCIINYDYCTSCLSDLYILIDNQCHCIDGYYYDSIDCRLCQAICTKCIDYNNCTACIDGYYLHNNQCLLCDNYCRTCITQPSLCLTCSDAYFMNDDGKCTKCIQYCKQCNDSSTCLTCYDGSYLEDTICIECSENCKRCVNRIDTCLSCNENFELIENRCYCINGYYESSNICIKCPYPCLECQSINYCHKCDSLPQLFLSNNNQCTCFQGYYLNNGNCQLCDSTCSTCSNTSINCLSCDQLQNRILQQNQCQCKGSYYEDENRICNSCNSEGGRIIKSCMYRNPSDSIWTYGEACDDGNSVQRDGCTNFNIDKGYTCINVILEKSICIKCPDNCAQCNMEYQCNICNSGYFILEFQCKKCSLSCLKCNNTPSACSACRFIQNSKTGECQICESNEGYYSNYTTNSCYSVCGDSILASNEECDDGNHVNGDGCDYLCHKESLYICQDGICITPQYPTPNLITQGNPSIYNKDRMFLLNYDEKLNIKNNINITDQIKLYLIKNSEKSPLNHPCQIVQHYDQDQNNFTNYSMLITLTLNSTSKNEMLLLEFTNAKQIISYQGYTQQITNISTIIREYELIDEQTVKRVKTVTDLNFNILIILAIIVAVAILTGGLDIYYNLLETLQMLSYLKYINTQLPYNLQEYFNLFQFAQFTFISNLMNIEQLIDPYIDYSKLKEIPGKIQDDQYKSLFIINGASNVVVQISLFGCYIIAKLLPPALNIFKPLDISNIPGKTDFPMRIRIYYTTVKVFLLGLCYDFVSELFYNGILRAQITTSYDYSFSIILQLYGLQLDSNEFLVRLSSFLSLIALFSYFFTIFYVVKITSLSKFVEQNTQIKKQIGTVFEGIKKQKYYGKYYNAILLIKKLLFQVIIIFCYSSPIIQAQSLTIITVLQSLFLIKFKPLEKIQELQKQIASEIILFLLIQMLAILTIDNQYLKWFSHDNIGWCCILLISAMLTIQLFYDSIQQWFFLINKCKVLKKIVLKVKKFFLSSNERQYTSPNLFEPI